MESFDFTLIERGGPVMWVLLAVSLFGFVIFIERTLFLHRGQIRTGQFLEGIRNLVGKGRRLEALTLCEDTPGPIPGRPPFTPPHSPPEARTPFTCLSTARISAGCGLEGTCSASRA